MVLLQVYTLLSDRLFWMLRVNHTVVSLTLFSVSGLLAIGFLFGDININSNYDAYSNNIVWTAAFGTYSATKLIQSMGRTPLCLRAFNSVLGLWLWCYLIIAFMLVDTSSMSPTEPMLIMPLVWELAYITSLIYIYRRVD